MICRLFVVAFAAAYLLALFVFLTGTYGWFGQPMDPLSALFLIPLGLPWNLIAVESFIGPVLAFVAPAINLALLILLCRYFRRRAKSETTQH